MKKVALFVWLIWTMNFAFAQKHAHLHHLNEERDSNFIEEQVARSFFEKIALGENYTITTLQDYLEKNNKNLTNGSLIFLYEKESPVGRHYHFQQQFKNLPVYNAEVAVNMDKKGNILSIFETTFDFTNSRVDISPIFAKAKQAPESAINQYLGKNKLKQWTDYQKVIIPTSTQTIRVGTKVVVSNEQETFINEIVLDDEGKEIYSKTKHQYFAPPQTTIEAIGYVFQPDPITSAEVVYGFNGGYIDNEDENRPELNAERVEVTLDVTFMNGIYTLDNQYVRMRDLNFPTIPPATSTTGVFDFGRGDDGFEDVNVFYHINTFQQYIQTLGIDNLNDKVEADALSTTSFGDDNSVYINLGTNNHRLLFGPGGVDDGEDADVIIHEYAHALSAQACRDCSVGTKRETLEEGLADYFATSYSRGISEYNWAKMFSWDGHNQFFTGRNMDNNKRYPESIVNNIHADSEIWSGAMMDIWEDLGQTATDQLMLNALYFFTKNIDLRQAAQIIVQQNQLLFDGENEDIIIDHFIRRGLWDLTISAGEDQTVCLGDTIILGGDTDLVEGLIPFWSPGYNMVDSTALNPIVMPDKSSNDITTYYLNILDPVTNFVLKDSVNVTVKYCFPAPPNPVIRLLNTDRFLRGRGNIIVEVPESTEEVNIDIFTINGQRLQHLTNQGDNRVEIDSRYFTTGLFLLKVKADNQQAFFKVSKVQ